MEASGARVAEQALELALLEHSEPTRDFERGVDNLPGALDRAVFCGHDLDRPCHPVIDAGRPVTRHCFELGVDRFELHHHLGDLMLDVGVVGHRTCQPQRSLCFDLFDGQVEGPLREPIVDVAEVDERPREDAEHEISAPPNPAGTTRAMF